MRDRLLSQRLNTAAALRIWAELQGDVSDMAIAKLRYCFSQVPRA